MSFATEGNLLTSWCGLHNNFCRKLFAEEDWVDLKLHCSLWRLLDQLTLPWRCSIRPWRSTLPSRRCTPRPISTRTLPHPRAPGSTPRSPRLLMDILRSELQTFWPRRLPVIILRPALPSRRRSTLRPCTRARWRLRPSTSPCPCTTRPWWPTRPTSRPTWATRAPWSTRCTQCPTCDQTTPS